MIFDITDAEFSILDIFKISRVKGQKPGICHGRAITSLSCRMSGGSNLESDGRIFKADADNYLFIGKNTPFTHYYDEEEVIAVHLSFTKNSPEGIELIPCSYPETKEKFLSLYEYWIAKESGYYLKCKALIYEIFYLFAKKNDEAEKIKPSMSYLYAYYTLPEFNIEKMISLSYLSPAYFRRIFKSAYGTSVVKYLNSLRVEHAKAMIASRKYSIGEIAELSGFSDEKYFSRVFRQITGLPPSEYR